MNKEQENQQTNKVNAKGRESVLEYKLEAEQLREQKSDVAKMEEKILKFWQENRIFEKSLEKDSPNGEFVFYDGPPFATGLPHYGHLLAGTIKDIIPRYKTMQGYHVPRKWGWDCHGLPIENLIEKELGLSTKKDIEDYGIGKFNSAARNSVLRYESEWKKIVPRSGRFVDMKDAYMAMDPEYMESIWWVFGELHKKGLTKEGFKAMHLCPRCETTLANFEVNQGYKDVTDISVIAKFELKDEPGTFLLAWTTTPWTLPGNVALAVGKDIDYVKINYDNFFYIVSLNAYKNGSEGIFEGKFKEGTTEPILPELVGNSFKGSDLAEREYVALFDYYQNDPETENRENGWKVLEADFVTTKEGTGIVHIAPAFGSDDMQLGEERDLPFVQHVTKSGAFKHVFAETTEGKDFVGMLVKQKDDLMSTDIEIIKRLAHDGKLFSKKKLVHSYPHCWRCDTPLLNYATTSWYVDVSKIKNQLIKSNKKVHWVPDHVGHGRFGKWLEGARDWALSRSRFWGTPLPIWFNPETEENIVIGSYEDLYSYAKKSGNNYYAIRHGESQSNLKGSINAELGIENGLTDLGKKQVQEEIEDLKNKNIDLIFVSPFQRTQETAEIIRKGLNLSKEQIIIDKRIRERNPGKKWEGKKWEDFHIESKKRGGEIFDLHVEKDSSSLKDTYKETTDFLFEIEKKHRDKNILFISHAGTIKSLSFAVEKRGLKRYFYDFYYTKPEVKNASVLKFDFVPFPHNKKMEFDIHKPHIDNFEVEQNGVRLERVKDVFDVWFDSSVMPYAQQHYPFENKKKFEKAFPAQFIAEGLDQTRGWFYVMTVIGNALFGKTPFENVIVNGLILAEDGKKMSKSLKNYPDPQLIFNTAGADAMRLYMINSPVVRAEEFAFSEKGVREVASKVMGRLRNTMSLYKMYAGDAEHVSSVSSTNILDKWIVFRFEELSKEVTESLNDYELDCATRPIFDFIDDLSTWYIRRSRDRYKSDKKEDKVHALGTTRYILENTSKVIAPFTPFVAEELWQDLRETDSRLEESVHLEDWPGIDKSSFKRWVLKISSFFSSRKRGKNSDDFIIEDMIKVREIISVGLQMRSDAKMKVRQPLESFTAPIKNIPEEYHGLIIDEMNVKQLIDGKLSLDSELTPELIEEGNMRELLRGIQSMRKKAGLDAHDDIVLIVQTDGRGREIIEKFESEIKRPAGITEFEWKENEGTEIKAGNLNFICKIK